MSPADRFDLVSTRFDHLVRAVPADRWDAPSPCAGWTARDVLRHVVETERDLLDRMGFALDRMGFALDRMGFALDRMGFAPPSVDGVDPIDAWPAVRSAMADALHDPARAEHAYDGHFGPTTFAATVDDFYSFDLVVHRWDLARAVGLSEHEAMDADELAHIRRSGAVFGEAARMPGVLGAELPAPADASEQERVLAWLGRDPRTPAGA